MLKLSLYQIDMMFKLNIFAQVYTFPLQKLCFFDKSNPDILI